MTLQTLSDLMPDEEVLYKTKPHWIVFGRAFVWLSAAILVLIFGSSIDFIAHFQVLEFPPFYKIISAIFLLVAAWHAVIAFIQREYTQYAITNKRVLAKSGLIRKMSTEIMSHKIEGIQSVQTFWGRLFNYGSIIVVGVGGSQDPFYYIPTPNRFKSKVQRLGMQS